MNKSMPLQKAVCAPWYSRVERAMVLCFSVLASAVIAGPAQSESSDVTSSTTTLVEIRERGAFVIGADIPYGVMEFFDEAGNPTGIDIEIADEIATALEVELSVKNMPFDQLFGALADGEIDAVVSAVTITQERQKEMLFSVPYMDAGMSIAVVEDNEGISSENDLSGKRVGVLKGTVGEELMRGSEFTDPNLVFTYESNEERISDLIAGELDAIIVHFISDAVTDLRLLEPPLTQSFYGIAVRLEDNELMASINSVLRDMKRSGEIDRIKEMFLNSARP